MKTLIKNLCGKLESWGIDPITLAKAIGIFLTTVTLIIIFIKFPVVFGILLFTLICVVVIILIYHMIDSYERNDN